MLIEICWCHNPRSMLNKERVRVIGVGCEDLIGHNLVMRINKDGSSWGSGIWVHSSNLKRVDFEQAEEQSRQEMEFEATKKYFDQQLKIRDDRIKELGTSHIHSVCFKIDYSKFYFAHGC